MDNSATSKNSGDNSATRRNTRSTSNQEKEKTQEIPESSKSNSSNSSTRDRDCTTNMETTKKKACDRVERGPNGEVLSYTTEDDVTYRLSDSAYLETERPDVPYSICTIQEIKVSKRDSAIVYVKWYYRPTEVPDLVYQMLIKNRYNQVGDSEVKNLIMNQDVINRELFLDERMEATDSFSVGNLKGKCQVTHYTDVSEIKNFELQADHFFYICSYSPENRRLASSQGETRVGPSHQWSARMRGMFQKADLPDLLQPSERKYEDGRVYEEMTWQPNVEVCDLIMCLRAARSLAAFAGVCDGVLPEEGCIAACRDDTTINALRVLYENNGNPRKAIDDLVKNPVPITIDSKWTEDQVKRFQKGLRHHGKNFFQIRKELLPNKETGELVEFYYLSKKSQESLMIRSTQRKHRRQATMKKTEGKQKSSSYCSGDHTSTEEETESEESEKELNTKCAHCQKPTTSDLKIGGKESVKLCLDCRMFFKKYGENRPVLTVDEVESTNETDTDISPAPKSTIPPFLFKPIKEEKPNVLLPKKPPKSLPKVKPTAEIKKPVKREWPDDVRSEPIAGTISSKRPKSEQEENEEQHVGEQHSQAFVRDQVPCTDTTGAIPNKEGKVFPLPRQSLHSRIIPRDIEGFPASHSASKMNLTLPYEMSPLSSSAKTSEVYTPSIGPFVPATQASQRLSVKPSELEAISKLAMSPGSIPGSRYSTVAYAGTTPSQGPAANRGNSAYSPPCSTTVIMTNGVRSTPAVEQPNSNVSRHPPRNNGQERSTNDESSNSRTEKVNESQFDKSKYKAPDSREAYAGPSTPRGFPFDPRVTDRIINNANMPRPIVKEEAVTSSSMHRDAPRPEMSQASHSREQLMHRNVKQEAYLYHPMHPGRPVPQEIGQQQHQPQPQRQMYPPARPSSHSSSHRSSPERYHQPSVPPPPSSQFPRPVQEQDDSDIELVKEMRPSSPAAVRVEIPCSYGYSARFMKTWDRGSNSCFRTDFVFAVDEASRKRRQERQREEIKKQQKEANDNVKTSQQKRPPTPPLPTNRVERREEKAESRERPKRDNGPPPPQPGPAPYRSTPGHMSVPRSTPTSVAAAYDQQHLRPTGAFVSPIGAQFGSDTPALRHLQHIASIDFQRHAAMAEAGMPVASSHPLYRYYQLMGIDPEAAERELRERDRLAKMGELKPHEMLNPHMPHLHPNALAGLPIGALPGQPVPSMEQIHQYQAQLLNSLPPGAHPHAAAAALQAANMSHGALAAAQLEAYTAERMSFERMQAERLAAAEQQYQLELLHHHSHSHVHSHLHLHGGGQGGGPPPAGTPLPIPALPPPGPALAVADPLLNQYAAVQAMGPLVSGTNPLLAQSMIRSQQAALMQQGLVAPHLSAAAALAAREQAVAAQQHPFTQHLQAVNEQHVMESQHRARAVAALQEQQFLNRYKS